MWKRFVFSKNLRLTEPFFKNAGVKQPEYGEVMRNMLKDAFDFAFRHPQSAWFYPKNIDYDIDKKSIPILEEMRYGGIFLTAHYGNHEILGYRLAEAALPLNAAAHRQRPKLFDMWLQKKRTFKGKCFARKVEVERLIEFMDSGALFALLADQDFRKSTPVPIKNKCESEFLGINVRCNPLPVFILEHRPDIPVFCGYLQQIRDNQTLFLKKLPKENFYAHYHSWLESLILKNPAKWYGWFHNRFHSSL